jgi:hypothetical protein
LWTHKTKLIIKVSLEQNITMFAIWIYVRHHMSGSHFKHDTDTADSLNMYLAIVVNSKKVTFVGNVITKCKSCHPVTEDHKWYIKQPIRSHEWHMMWYPHLHLLCAFTVPSKSDRTPQENEYKESTNTC